MEGAHQRSLEFPLQGLWAPPRPTLGLKRATVHLWQCGSARTHGLCRKGRRGGRSTPTLLLLPPWVSDQSISARCSVTWRRQAVAGPSFRDERVASSLSTGTGSSTGRASAASAGTSGWGTNTSTGSPDGRPGYVWRWRRAQAWGPGLHQASTCDCA